MANSTGATCSLEIVPDDGQPDDAAATRANRSAVWDYFQKESAVSASCNRCSARIQTPSGSTTSLVNHLKRHSLVYAEFKKKHEAKKAEQPRIDKFATKRQLPRARREALDVKVARMVALDYQPYSVVEDRGFRELLAEAVPDYCPPSRTTLSRTLIPKLFHDTRSAVQAELEAALQNGVESMSFTSDMWTSRSNASFISLTCHFVDHRFHVKRYNLDTCSFSGRHTATQISLVLRDMVKDWNVPLDKFPIYIVTDNARNFRAAARDLPWAERACYAHSLQLAIGSAKELTTGLSPLLKKARAIVGHYKHSSQAQERLDSYQKAAGKSALHLIQDIDTRWNSEYAMLQRLLELREPITLDMAKHESLVDCLTGTEWRLASDYVKVLRPLAEATVEAQGEKYPTLSCQVPSLYCIFQSLKCNCDHDMTSEGKTFSANVEKSLRTRFPDYNMDNDACMAMFCDPRYKTVVFRNDSAREEWLKTLAQEQLNYSDPGKDYGNEHEGGAVASSSLWAAFDTMVETQDKGNDPSKEIRAYIDDKTISRNADPCKWWREVGQYKYPAVATLARRYLAIPATSASSERAFSAAGNVATQCRAALLPEHIRQLTFLHDNL